VFQIKVVEKIETHFISNNFFLKNGALYEVMRKIWYRQTDHR
jgi:hypothetical protein